MKTKFPRGDALRVVRELLGHLEPAMGRVIVAGSLRRRKDAVGDIELLYIPRMIPGGAVDLFMQAQEVDMTELPLERLLAAGVLTKRLNAKGSTMWGPKNKLATHVASGIPVDLFAATEENWWSYLVCRTGSGEHNIRLASAFQAKGEKWEPYGPGWKDRNGDQRRVGSEQELFAAAGLGYLEPWERDPIACGTVPGWREGKKL